ncbi:60S ribosomal protein L28-2 [Tetrabaena socialis]|uniref:60S ribosomal protein L28-2 n=1 Tax=Tetrabaena socialis TaxID=47790 RepID=A0A2J8AEQ2_9CHLO|nr:60S ribosomal protein L28-2 [Tetrabaena socialis]|eukprot:PNH10998.1 60S ribosomal protein L28-2 [Tetrabaena socialis]
MSSALVWELIKKHNSFTRPAAKGGFALSAEPGNLLNKHSYKFSGLADTKTVAIAAEGDAVKFTVGRVKTAQQPKKSKHSVVIKKDGRAILKAVGKQVASYRPDLKSAALARASAVHKSIRVKKAKKSA